MQIKEMFKRDINRYINGVISVAEQNTIKQELEEYVVTRELQRHFADFFQAYERGLDNPERNPGVWIQGYFGSGKSHFLKMLSYLLENKEVDGENAVDYFEDKFDDLMTYASIVRSSNAEAETILFNIDDKGGCYKEGETSETAVLRSIARVFYEHLGFYGMDYKLARFEKLIDDRGKTDEFRAAYEEITGNPWVEDRGSYDIFGGEVAEAANRAVGMSIKSVTDWADSTESALVDFGQLVDDIDEYAQKRERECGKQFRLLFMIDEMGQYLNGDTSRMLNLQTFMEKFCDRCGGRVWMVVTSQEAIDELMNDYGFEAVYVASGAGLPRFMGIPGESLNGVYSANEYLTRVNLMKAYKEDSRTPIMKSKSVAVVGGGNVAMDAARCAKRLGAENVYIVYRRGMAELPARKEEVEHAEEEGIVFKTLTNPTEVLGDENGWVKGMTCVEMELGEPDASGRRRPIVKEGSEFVLNVDTMIMALGTSPNPLIRSTTPGLDADKHGCLITNGPDGLTSRPMVYAGGDAVTGAATVILAMGAGKEAARAIDAAIKAKEQ